MSSSMKDVFYHALLARARYGLMETGNYADIQGAITDQKSNLKKE